MIAGASVRSASYWAVIEQFARQGALFVVSLVLARLLTPKDFGLVALVLFFSGLGVTVLHSGLQTALVRKGAEDPASENSVFWFCVSASILFGAGIVAAGPLIATWFAQPMLAPLMIAAAAQLVAAAFAIVPTAILNRRFEIRPIAIAGLISTALSGTVGILAALNGAGVWAIALHLVVNQAITSAILWLSSGWRPAFTFDREALAREWKFSSYLSASGALDLLYSSGFSVIIGKLHGFVELGLFNRAQGTQQLPGNVVGAVITRMAVPLFARHANDDASLRADMRSTIRLAMLFNVPAMAFLAVASHDILITLFGEQWSGAAPILTILAIGGTFYPLHVINLQLLIAQGRSDRFFAVETIKKVIGIGLVVAGSFFGVIGLAVSQLVFNVVAFGLNARYGGERIGIGAVSQLRQSIVPMLIGCSVVVVCLFVGWTFTAAPALKLMAQVGASAMFVLPLFALQVRSWRPVGESNA